MVTQFDSDVTKCSLSSCHLLGAAIFKVNKQSHCCRLFAATKRGKVMTDRDAGASLKIVRRSGQTYSDITFLSTLNE